MDIKRFFTGVIYGTLLSICTSGGTYADDIDIYFTNNSSDAEPLVMFSIDWRPNLTATVCNACDSDAFNELYDGGYLDKDPSTDTIEAFDLYRAVLKKVFEPLEGVRVGLMLNHDDPGGKSCTGPQTGSKKCTNGGFIPFGFRSLEKNDGNGAKADFHAMLASMPLPQGTQSHKYQASELFFELYRYLTGGDIFNAHNGWTSFDSGSDSSTANIDTEHSEITWDTLIENGNKYKSPLTGNVASDCGGGIFTLNFMFGTLNSDADSDDEIEDGMPGIKLGNSNNARFESILQYLNDVDLSDTLDGRQNVTSYFLVPAANNTENGFAQAGGTNAAIELSDDPEVLVETIQSIFNEILSISTTFVSASVPINVYNRAEVSDNVFLALFQPMETARWPGNVKKLKINATDPENLFLVDANNTPAVSSDGRIRFNALTFWTDSADLPYPDPNISGNELEELVDGKDGRFVPRGGAGQMISGIPGADHDDPELSNSDAGARQLYTEASLGGSTLMALNANVLTAAELYTSMDATAAEALCLLKYARGYEITNLTSCDDPGIRSWLMGDVLHSRPLAINYGGSPTSPDIRLVVGGNDGFLRMIRNNASTPFSAGSESWAFMPRAIMPILENLAINATTNGQHQYGVDGPVSAYIVDSNYDNTISAGDGDKAWIFFGFRRGGKAYYGLDVSNPDTPKFLWAVKQDGGDFAELGLTFSQPSVTQLDWGQGLKPVIVIGGGYDTNKDSSGTGTNDSEGNAVFIIDAETGDLVWKAVSSGSGSKVYSASGLVDSIPSNVTVLTNNVGTMKRLYVGDTGGVVWRGDFPSTDRSGWTLTAVLSVGRHAGSDDRRFFHPPDVSYTLDDMGAFDAIAIGSGDRANPLGSSVDNEFYMFKDRHIESSAPSSSYTRSDLADLTNNCVQEDSCSSDPNIEHGWRISFGSTGEKNLSSPLIQGGAIYFTTYIPPSGSSGSDQCGPAEGGGNLYTLNLQTAGAVVNYDTTNDSDELGDLHADDRVDPLDSGGIPSEVVALPVSGVGDDVLPIIRPDLSIELTPSKTNWKTFWHQKID